jgi:hypothetical protein
MNAATPNTTTVAIAYTTKTSPVLNTIALLQLAQHTFYFVRFYITHPTAWQVRGAKIYHSLNKRPSQNAKFY